MHKKKKIVCLGGGIGTANLIKGLKIYPYEITVIVSMADEGGSSGRLRRLYNIHPPGDVVSCMASFMQDSQNVFSTLLGYRFPGERYGKDGELGGQKLGNLLMVALRDISGSFEKAIVILQKLFDIPGTFLPSTEEPVRISALTIEGKEIIGEEAIDLGEYDGQRVLDQVFLHPKTAKAGKGVIPAIQEADVIIAGPGDLYTTILPVLLVSHIKNAILESKASKLFVVNVANKPFETKGYSVLNYVQAVKKHIHEFPFDTVIVNNNYSITIPEKFNYSYVQIDRLANGTPRILERDLIDKSFPLYHDSEKLANAVREAI